MGCCTLLRAHRVMAGRTKTVSVSSLKTPSPSYTLTRWVLCRHVMLAHLMQRTSLPKPMPGLSEQASFFLLSVCIRWAPSHPDWLHRHAGLAILSACAVPAACMHTTSELPASGLLPVLRSCLPRSSHPPQGPHVLAAIHEATLSRRQPSLQRFFASRLWVGVWLSCQRTEQPSRIAELDPGRCKPFQHCGGG